MNNGTIKTNDRLYYTGDMANSSDWATVTEVRTDKWGEHLEVRYDSGRTSRIESCMVGSVYNGTCNPRFVTEQAYKDYQDRSRFQAEAFMRKYSEAR